MRSRFLSVPLLAGLVWGTAAIPSPAADPSARKERPAPERSALDMVLRHTIGDWRWPEIVEMIWAIAGGREMAPGEGWFHPSQNRYGWEWLSARYDADKNGRITREGFQGPAELFDRLDRDHDGALAADDF